MKDKNKDILKTEDAVKKDNRTKVVIGLGMAIVVVAIILTIILISAITGIGKERESESIYETTSAQHTAEETDDAYIQGLLNNTDKPATTQDGAGGTKTDSQRDTTKNQVIESYEQLSPNGDNYLSDSYDNEFIRLVADKYGVDDDLLVAIYSVPDSGTNFVLQFNGKKKNGVYVKSPDTLEKVYQIDLNKNIKVATGAPTGNEGVSYAESVMCFNMVKVIVMEQYPDYFTGLKD